MAILNAGNILAGGKPDELVGALKGKIWFKTTSRAEAAVLAERHNVLSQRLSAGSLGLRVLADTCPEAGFQPVEPDLEDVYFTTLTEAKERV